MSTDYAAQAQATKHAVAAFELVWTCEHCGEPINDGEGELSVSRSACLHRRAARKAFLVKSDAEHADAPLVAWHVTHTTCAVAGGDYFCDVAGVRTSALLRARVKRLLGTAWLRDTNWGTMLREQA